MELYEKNGNILYILNILKKYTDEEHLISIAELQRKIKEIYDVDIDSRTIRRNINLLKEKLNYDISTRQENGKGYYINRNPDTDFEPGEIRAIIDNFSYANYIVPSISSSFNMLLKISLSLFFIFKILAICFFVIGTYSLSKKKEVNASFLFKYSCLLILKILLLSSYFLLIIHLFHYSYSCCKT